MTFQRYTIRIVKRKLSLIIVNIVVNISNQLLLFANVVVAVIFSQFNPLTTRHDYICFSPLFFTKTLKHAHGKT